MAISFIDKAEYQGPSSAITTVPLTWPGTSTTGDLAIVTVVSQNATAIASPSGWTDVITPIGSTSQSVGVWYRFKQGGDTSISVTTPSARAVGHMLVFRGVDATTPLDVTVPATVAGTTAITFPAITPVTAGAWIVATNSAVQASTSTYGWSSTNLDTTLVAGIISGGTTTATDAASAAGVETTWTSGAFTPTAASVGATTRTRGVTFALRPAPAAAAPLPPPAKVFPPTQIMRSFTR